MLGMTRDFIKERLLQRSLRLAQVQQRSALVQAAMAASQTYRNGLISETKSALDEIFSVDPKQPDAQMLRGVMHYDEGSFDAAEPFLVTAVSERQNFPLAHYNLGNVYRETRRYPLAITSYQTVIEQAPRYYFAHGNLGLTYLLMGDDVQALDYLNQAITLKPDYPEGLDNLGTLLTKQGMLAEACELFERALSSNPMLVSGYNNLGNAMRDMGDMDGAITQYKQAIKLNPELAEAHNNLGLVYLLTGQFQKGWDKYQWRHKLPDGLPPPPVNPNKPSWDGAPFKDKTLYIHPEQGFGDVLQFSRYVPIVAKLGGRVIYRVSPKLVGLIDHLEGVDVVNLETEPRPDDYDFHLSLLDIPRLLQTDQATIPGNCPYLDVDDKSVSTWSNRVGENQGFKIGLVWAGHPKHENDRNRSIDPRLLLPLSQIPGISLYSLQMGKEGQAGAVFGEAITDLAPHIETFADTAAAIKNLDLVISADTAPIHLAGAIGHPVWTLLPFTPDWRWQLGRTDSPWYPTMKLFRQPAPGDWVSVIDAIASQIKKMANA